MALQDDRVEVFRRLHVGGCFVMPNPWDVGTAVALEPFGFVALATTGQSALNAAIDPATPQTGALGR
jgi:2-methylisocitrate lyase-like PEP mutase family enzyme